MAEPAPEAVHIPLPFGKPQPVAELGGTVALTSGKRDTVQGPDGRLRHDATVGTLVFARQGEAEQSVDFVSGQAFSHAGRDMAVYGDRSLELVIAPPGQAPRP